MFEVDFTGAPRQHPGGSWWFVAVPCELSDEIRSLTAGHRRGFGSLRVEGATCSSTWRTSIFPDAARGTFLLPVRRAVREAEDLEDGRAHTFRLRLIDVG